MFLAKFDASGKHIWSRKFGGDPHGQGPTSLALDSNGDAVVSGLYLGDLNFGTTPLKDTIPGARKLFLAKLRLP